MPEPTPAAAIVGRPNVGKSTLFNRLIGRRQAIVHNLPGVTRDRVTALCRLDEGRSVMLIDTGGLIPSGDTLGINRQVMAAVEECDLVILVVDGKAGLLPGDEEIWARLRQTGKRALLAVNKGDTRSAREQFSEFHSLGVEPQILVSAEHGRGVEELREALMSLLPERSVPEEADAPRLAIVGRPNVGKSSLVNRIVGAERVLVSDTPGTTRDPVDTLVEWAGKRYLLVDTAGIRRRSRTADQPEELAVMMARRQIEGAELALLMIEAPGGVTSGDLAIAGTIQELGRASVVLVNKWDLITEEGRRRLDDSWPRLEQLLSAPRRVNISATSGRGVDRLPAVVEETLLAFHASLSTSRLNEILRRAVARHQAPRVEGTPWKLFYATQVSSGPPTFLLFANRPLKRGHPYRRFLENSLKADLALAGVPVRMVIRQRS